MLFTLYFEDIMPGTVKKQSNQSAFRINLYIQQSLTGYWHKYFLTTWKELEFQCHHLSMKSRFNILERNTPQLLMLCNVNPVIQLQFSIHQYVIFTTLLYNNTE